MYYIKVSYCRTGYLDWGDISLQLQEKKEVVENCNYKRLQKQRYKQKNTYVIHKRKGTFIQEIWSFMENNDE